MKLSIPFLSFIISAFGLLLLAACKASPTEPEPVPSPTRTPTFGALPTATAVTPIVEESLPEAIATMPALAVSYTEDNPLPNQQ